MSTVQGTHGGTAPSPVKTQAQHPIKQIVAWCNRIEHRLDLRTLARLLTYGRVAVHKLPGVARINRSRYDNTGLDAVRPDIVG